MTKEVYYGIIISVNQVEHLKDEETDIYEFNYNIDSRILCVFEEDDQIYIGFIVSNHIEFEWRQYYDLIKDFCKLNDIFEYENPKLMVIDYRNE